jgi:hypothetical protein
MNAFPAADVLLAAPSHAKISSNRNIFSLSMMPRPVIVGGNFSAQ